MVILAIWLQLYLESAVGSGMRRVLPFLFIFALSIGRLLSADEPLIDPTDAPTHIGQNVTVSGLIVAVVVSSAGTPSLILATSTPTRRSPAGSLQVIRSPKTHGSRR
jgi:hypothetical protein